MDSRPPLNLALARRVEDHFFKAWPAMAEMDLDGWRVRIAGGYSDRANSVTPHIIGTQDIADKLRWCEQFYEVRHLPVIFRIADFQAHDALEVLLQGRGYKMSWAMETAACDLTQVNHSANPHVQLVDRAVPAWCAAALAIDPRIEPYRVPFQFIVDHMPAPKCFAQVIVDGAAVSIGAATVLGDLMGVFLMRTRLERRRQGHGRAVLDTLLAWGKSHGAKTAWLQFDHDADAARALYRSVGFNPLYSYHYRRKP